jgi:phosphatidylglycerophosphate synthase
MADALSAMRLLLAVAMPWLLARGGALPLLAWGLAALSDWADGPLARRTGTATLRGAVLDNVADIAFVLGGLVTAAALGLVPWILPAAIALSAGAYALASRRARPTGGGLARSGLGHWGGVLNYACLGGAAAAVGWPHPAWATPLGALALVTAGVNLAAVACRLAAGRQRTASRSS